MTCPVCGESSTKIYRCTSCGADLVETGTEGREDA
ncbi:small CPxCG-related zinc finger protein [Natronomonas pharaonis DSM 2160]|uniref:Small CPxCG-related zinc finger protein n=1 Tax=Natronomonas pharaonis (strain ATCC 35678 / DSM 2160 / CIP 103997 / JCM 8858 / NBRC 14720 / NCIMB 2260 / Gabara) TaxID=348780 RepID=A0A1U7EZR2_NATPD|nr:small CPxCG-related zinc finger protein [Natronomonas pharaonis DSM 2160]